MRRGHEEAQRDDQGRRDAIAADDGRGAIGRAATTAPSPISTGPMMFDTVCWG
jgi:hypothetical protein